jgi:hypothetical protein
MNNIELLPSILLRRLVNLEDLSQVFYPKVGLWREVHAVGGHARLRKMDLYYSHADEEQVTAMVLGLNRDFPALAELQVTFINIHGVSLERTAEVLAGLNSHPSLRSISCIVVDDPESFGIFSRSMQELTAEHRTVRIEYPQLSRVWL